RDLRAQTQRRRPACAGLLHFHLPYAYGAGATPVPVKLTTSMRRPLLLTIVSVPPRTPGCSGRNVTSMLHDAPTASGEAQSCVWLYSPADPCDAVANAFSGNGCVHVLVNTTR